MNFTGLLLKESLKNEDILQEITITKEEKWSIDNATSDQPKEWTALYYNGKEEDASRTASQLSDSLREGKWYTNFTTSTQVFVIFPGKVFAYKQDDSTTRESAKEYGRSIGIPESQLDWD